MNLSRKTFFLILLAGSAAGQPLAPRLDDGHIGIHRPAIQFLTGKPLEKLKNGQSVSFDFQLQLFDGPKPLGRSLRRFVLSYDLWEESYSAVMLSQTGSRQPVDTVSHLKADAIAGWCFSRILLPFPPQPVLRPLTLQMEIRSSSGKLPNPLRPQGGIDLGVLVEIFSRPPEAREFRYVATSEPFELAGLRQP